MKTRVFIAAAVLLASMSAPAFATYCDIRNDEDKASRCASKCDDSWHVSKMVYGAESKIDEIKAAAKACFEKCGCDENYTKDIAPVTKF